MQCHSHGQMRKASSESIYSDRKINMLLRPRLLISPYCEGTCARKLLHDEKCDLHGWATTAGPERWRE